ncbi:uncharacterized protein TM35_000231050 [Trypanosoma theileri]|uniref:Uncharacterized protein n=1 Tax=Trypanosoma theileri TaxID=67003 RepID=A0A1X0NR13_9TRYP|nr:uncharacterized protein TM35_000231050 [Trypanosoma theileri]ORC87134.1 hypothetical protein TM35_000231050 [Trypanosoma theileri]
MGPLHLGGGVGKGRGAAPRNHSPQKKRTDTASFAANVIREIPIIFFDRAKTEPFPSNTRRREGNKILAKGRKERTHTHPKSKRSVFLHKMSQHKRIFPTEKNHHRNSRESYPFAKPAQ